MRGDPPRSSNTPALMSVSTPHARGSTPPWSSGSTLYPVYPACAGIHLELFARQQVTGCLPRMRGDPPPGHQEGIAFAPSTPHARGSTCTILMAGSLSRVYPACAGIHPFLRILRPELVGLPRMRGDPPTYLGRFSIWSGSTPHARGSTLRPATSELEQPVYPACAGIHLFACLHHLHKPGLPRMRGDPPYKDSLPEW